MSFATVAVVGAGASLIGTGVSAGMSGSAAAQSRKDYMAGLKAAADMYQLSRKDINKYMTPYVNSGTRNLNMLNSALDPTASADYSMPDKPGAAPVWADYQNRGVQQWKQPAKGGLASMMKKGV